MNRISLCIKNTKDKLDHCLATGEITPEQVATAGKSADLDLESYFVFQEMKSLAVASGILSSEEAMTVYGYLGKSLDHYNDQAPEVKVVLMKLFLELLELRSNQPLEPS